MENELIELLGFLPSGSDSIKTVYHDKIRTYKPSKKIYRKSTVSFLIRLGALVAFFTSLYFILYFLFFYQEDLTENKEASAGVAEEINDEYEYVTNEEAFFVNSYKPPLVIDEVGADIIIDDYFTDSSNETQFYMGEGVKVLVIHSHTAEMVSENISVVDAGEAIVSLLNYAGIGALHCKDEHDDIGRIGAYNRMKDSAESIAEEHTGMLLIIDLHSSEKETKILFDIGVAIDYSWKENLRAAASIYNKMNQVEAVVRLLPRDLGQNCGIVTVSIAIGYPECDDESSRKLISELALSIIDMFKESTPEIPG